MKKLYVLIGPPSVGKSTWIKNNFNNNPFIISRDDIVDIVAKKCGFTYDEMYITPNSNENVGDVNEKFGTVIISPSWMKYSKTSYEKIISANNEVKTLFENRIKEAKNHNIVIVDMTNMSKNARKNSLDIVDNSYKKIAVHFNFKGNEDTIKLMNKKRAEELRNNGIFKTISDNVYDMMYTNYQEVTTNEGFNKIIYVDNIKKFKNILK